MENQQEKVDVLDSLLNKGKGLAGNLRKITWEWGTYYEIIDEENYHLWIAQCIRYISVYYPDELSRFEELSKKGAEPKIHQQLLGVLGAIKLIPEINPHLKKDDISKININNYNSQTQNQTQSQQIAIQLFLEAIKDELTGKQTKELKQIIEDHKDEPEKIKPKLLEKLESFGIGVLSGIVGNILTNPQILSGFMG